MSSVGSSSPEAWVEPRTEHAFLDQLASDLGIPTPVANRRRSGGVSFLQWGTDGPRVAFVHGRGQNAHTFDGVLLRLGEPAIAVDLPGHGRSSWRDDHDYSPRTNAVAVAEVLALFPTIELCVGMSLGGLTLISLAARCPELVRRCLLIDITPGAGRGTREGRGGGCGMTELMTSDRVFSSFDEMCSWARDVTGRTDSAAFRRGLWHNSLTRADGSRAWRADRAVEAFGERDYSDLWSDVPQLPPQTRLLAARGSGVVGQADAQRLAQLRPGLVVSWVDTTMHSIHSVEPDVVAGAALSLLAAAP